MEPKITLFLVVLILVAIIGVPLIIIFLSSRHPSRDKGNVFKRIMKIGSIISAVAALSVSLFGWIMSERMEGTTDTWGYAMYLYLFGPGLLVAGLILSLIAASLTSHFSKKEA